MFRSSPLASCVDVLGCKMALLLERALYLCLLTLPALVMGYIPALPSNDTQLRGGPNSTDISTLSMSWRRDTKGPNDPSYIQSVTVSYQLVGNNSQGLSTGALVHFSEETSNNNTPPTNTPWVALIHCDNNATNLDLENDIFTLARDKGARAALLYSSYSEACLINPFYADPAQFDQVFDIFSTQSLLLATFIQNQLAQLTSNAISSAKYTTYDSQRLNDSEPSVLASVEQHKPVNNLVYMLATLRAWNSTAPDHNMSNGTDSSIGTAVPQSKTRNTGVAMIVLYAVTGCVSALFCVVIVSGAVRALRHPERYGPRIADTGEEGQSRARGITRALLDTMAVVKFGTTATSSPPPGKDVERGSQSHSDGRGRTEVVELTDWEVLHRNEAAPSPSTPPATDDLPPARPRPVTQPSRSGLPAPTSGVFHPEETVVPAAIGRETCPICILDFEEGEDLRVLPCEGNHRFHKDCVDPWLLELSSSCPICRQDFHALEAMLARDDEEEYVTSSPRRSGMNRFSRYVRFARLRRRRREGDTDITEPPMPVS